MGVACSSSQTSPPMMSVQRKHPSTVASTTQPLPEGEEEEQHPDQRENESANAVGRAHRQTAGWKPTPAVPLSVSPACSIQLQHTFSVQVHPQPSNYRNRCESETVRSETVRHSPAAPLDSSPSPSSTPQKQTSVAVVAPFTPQETLSTDEAISFAFAPSNVQPAQPYSDPAGVDSLPPLGMMVVTSATGNCTPMHEITGNSTPMHVINLSRRPSACTFRTPLGLMPAAPNLAPTVAAPGSISVAPSPYSTAPPSPFTPGHHGFGRLRSDSASSRDSQPLLACQLPFAVQQQRARELEKGMEALLAHPPNLLNLNDPSSMPAANPSLVISRVTPQAVPSWSPFPSPRIQPGQEPPPPVRRKLTTVAQKQVWVVLDHLERTGQIESSLGCHRLNQPDAFLTELNEPSAQLRIGQRLRPVAGGMCAVHTTPAMSPVPFEGLAPPCLDLMDPMLLEGLASPPRSASPTTVRAETVSLARFPFAPAANFSDAWASPTAPLSRQQSQSTTSMQAPESENLSQLEYRLTLLALKSEWKTARTLQPKLSLFNLDAYATQGLTQDQINSPPHPDQVMDLMSGPNTVMSFLKEINAGSRTPGMNGNTPPSLLSVTSGTSSPLMSPLSNSPTNQAYWQHQRRSSSSSLASSTVNWSPSNGTNMLTGPATPMASPPQHVGVLGVTGGTSLVRCSRRLIRMPTGSAGSGSSAEGSLQLPGLGSAPAPTRRVMVPAGLKDVIMSDCPELPAIVVTPRRIEKSDDGPERSPTSAHQRAQQVKAAQVRMMAFGNLTPRTSDYLESPTSATPPSRTPPSSASSHRRLTFGQSLPMVPDAYPLMQGASVLQAQLEQKKLFLSGRTNRLASKTSFGVGEDAVPARDGAFTFPPAPPGSVNMPPLASAQLNS
jgi:hypothetical protein